MYLTKRMEALGAGLCYEYVKMKASMLEKTTAFYAFQMANQCLCSE